MITYNKLEINSYKKSFKLNVSPTMQHPAMVVAGVWVKNSPQYRLNKAGFAVPLHEEPIKSDKQTQIFNILFLTSIFPF